MIHFSQNPFEIYQTAKLNQTFWLKNQNFSPFDLTSYSIITTCFQNADGTELSLSIGNGITLVSDPATGGIILSLTAAQTEALQPVDVSDLVFLLSTGEGQDPIPCIIKNAYYVKRALC